MSSLKSARQWAYKLRDEACEVLERSSDAILQYEEAYFVGCAKAYKNSLDRHYRNRQSVGSNQTDSEEDTYTWYGPKLLEEMVLASIAESELRSFVHDHRLTPPESLLSANDYRRQRVSYQLDLKKAQDEETGRQARATPSQSSTIFNPGFETVEPATLINPTKKRNRCKDWLDGLEPLPAKRIKLGRQPGNGLGSVTNGSGSKGGPGQPHCSGGSSTVNGLASPPLSTPPENLPRYNLRMSTTAQKAQPKSGRLARGSPYD